MLDLFELKQFLVFSQCGTLSKTSEILYVSQPTLTRSMKHMEEEFGASLFTRSRNRLELNDTGRVAAEAAGRILALVDDSVRAVQEAERNARTITIFSCAPMPLWHFAPLVSARYPQNAVVSEIMAIGNIISALKEGRCNVAILPSGYMEEGFADVPYIQENLYACIPEDNPLSGRKDISFADIDGYNCLLMDNIGFWNGMVKEKMPSSRFLVQKDASEFQELVRASSLLSFSTDVSGQGRQTAPENRKAVHIVDECANVRFHLICRQSDKALLAVLDAGQGLK